MKESGGAEKKRMVFETRIASANTSGERHGASRSVTNASEDAVSTCTCTPRPRSRRISQTRFFSSRFSNPGRYVPSGKPEVSRSAPPSSPSSSSPSPSPSPSPSGGSSRLAAPAASPTARSARATREPTPPGTPSA